MHYLLALFFSTTVTRSSLPFKQRHYHALRLCAFNYRFLCFPCSSAAEHAATSHSDNHWHTLIFVHVLGHRHQLFTAAVKTCPG